MWHAESVCLTLIHTVLVTVKVDFLYFLYARGALPLVVFDGFGCKMGIAVSGSS